MVGLRCYPQALIAKLVCAVEVALFAGMVDYVVGVGAVRWACRTVMTD